MRLIDADKATKILHTILDPLANKKLIWLAWDVILEDCETIDAEPVRHGHWNIKTINTFDLAYGTTGYEPVYQCSVCGGVMESYLRLEEPIMPEDASFPRYCPNCGAKMDKEMME